MIFLLYRNTNIKYLYLVEFLLYLYINQNLES
jgi:hypothetical protein